ncbi:MAG: isoprenylcysteine carboxylmethyltransferase family protein [Bacteroidales bacterium]|nr:isoprenylcysteine carboxylmethyltransferase family protein [Bacteroidales bacterium]
MNKDKKMILGYITGGLLVIGLMPLTIYIITSLLDKIFRLEIIQNSIIRWFSIILLIVIGLIYGIWSIIIQNTIGKGGPVEIGNIEISPKTENLVVSGPYKNTRNPMLFGTFLIYFAFALFINSITSVILVLAIFVFMLTVVVKMEEKRLLKDFGNQYEEYRGKVSKFIPWFKKTNNKNCLTIEFISHRKLNKLKIRHESTKNNVA